MRVNLFISLALTAALSGAAAAENLSTEVQAAKPQVSLQGQVQQRAIPRALFYEKERPVITPELLLTAGYLTVYDHPFGTIIDHYEKNAISASPGDWIYVNKGLKDGVKKGDVFYVYNRSEPVLDPDTEDEAGYIVSIVGIITIEEVSEETSGASVTMVYDIMQRGDALLPRYEVKAPQLDPDRPLDDKTIEAKVMTVRNGKKGIAENDIVYLNAGRKQGVAEGDIFKVVEHREERNPEEGHGLEIDLGRVQVISVRQDTATALVINAYNEIRAGDRLTYVQER